MTQAVFLFRQASQGRLLRLLHSRALPKSLWMVNLRRVSGVDMVATVHDGVGSVLTPRVVACRPSVGVVECVLQE